LSIGVALETVGIEICGIVNLVRETSSSYIIIIE
jgi:hypothetical protein